MAWFSVKKGRSAFLATKTRRFAVPAVALHPKHAGASYKGYVERELQATEVRIYPGVGPEHAWLKESGRVTYSSSTDAEALAAFQLLSIEEGTSPRSNHRMRSQKS